jgi:hypothetical protein
MDALEAIADAIMHFEGWVPGSRSYRNRNPGNLEHGGHVDDKGYNVYTTFIEGYAALLLELKDKFTGHNVHGIGPDSTLLALFNVYAPPSDNNPTNKYCEFVASYASTALGRTITPSSLLSTIWDGS